MLTPIGTSGVRRDKRSANSPAPWLLNPIRLSSARSSGSRNIRGGALPGCACAVTVPTSAYPKPSAPHVLSPLPSRKHTAKRKNRRHATQEGKNPGVNAFGGDEKQRPPQRAVHQYRLFIDCSSPKRLIAAQALIVTARADPECPASPRRSSCGATTRACCRRCTAGPG